MQGGIRWRGQGDPLQELEADMIWQRQRMFMGLQFARRVRSRWLREIFREWRSRVPLD